MHITLGKYCIASDGKTRLMHSVTRYYKASAAMGFFAAVFPHIVGPAVNDANDVDNFFRAKKMGYHPFPRPTANTSQAYTNSDGAKFGECKNTSYPLLSSPACWSAPMQLLPDLGKQSFELCIACHSLKTEQSGTGPTRPHLKH